MQELCAFMSMLALCWTWYFEIVVSSPYIGLTSVYTASICNKIFSFLTLAWVSLGYEHCHCCLLTILSSQTSGHGWRWKEALWPFRCGIHLCAMVRPPARLLHVAQDLLDMCRFFVVLFILNLMRVYANRVMFKWHTVTFAYLCISRSITENAWFSVHSRVYCVFLRLWPGDSDPHRRGTHH